jgi:phage baseplate assembly protein W
MSSSLDRGKEYLGQGLAFPLHINARGEIALASPEKDIEQAIGIILSTRPGERVMRPEFGCRAHELLFEPLHSGTETLMQQYVAEALSMWEPRIDLDSVEVWVDPEADGTLLVEIHYTIKATHDERSIVYPFFLVGQEGW